MLLSQESHLRLTAALLSGTRGVAIFQARKLWPRLGYSQEFWSIQSWSSVFWRQSHGLCFCLPWFQEHAGALAPSGQDSACFKKPQCQAVPLAMAGSLGRVRGPGVALAGVCTCVPGAENLSVWQCCYLLASLAGGARKGSALAFWFELKFVGGVSVGRGAGHLPGTVFIFLL